MQSIWIWITASALIIAVSAPAFAGTGTCITSGALSGHRDESFPAEFALCLLDPTSLLDGDNDDFGNKCDADIDQDCNVGFGDFLAFAAAFNTISPALDFDENGTVGFGDFAVFAIRFGTTVGP